MGSLEEILERVQYKFASIIGELCGEPVALSQFAIWVDLRLAEYKLKGSISLDCSGQKTDPEWLRSIKTISCSSDDPHSNQSTVLPVNNCKILPPNAASVNHVNLNASNVACGPFSSPLSPIEKRPPYAHSAQPPFAHSGPIAETMTINRVNIQDREETNSFQDIPEILAIKKEIPEQIHDFQVTRSFLSSPLLHVEGKKRTMANGSNLRESTLHSTPKFPRIEDGPPPLKPLLDNASEAYNVNRNFQQPSACNVARPLTFEGDLDGVESDSENTGSDVPEDLSMSSTKNHRNQSSSVQPSWTDQCINGLLAEPPTTNAVMHSCGRHSCLSNGPKFTEQWRHFVTNRSINLKSMSAERYQGYMDLLKVAQSKVHVPKSVKEHKMLYKFDLWRDDSSERLIKKRHKDTDPVRFYISDDQLFHALLAVHLDSGHGGIKKMLTLCKERYANITADAVKLFNHLCFDCQTRKRPMPPKLKEQSDTGCLSNSEPPLVNADSTLSNSNSSSSVCKNNDPT